MYICEEDTLFAKYDSCIKVIEVDAKPTKDYNDIGGLNKQIEELEKMIKIQKFGYKTPKGVLMYGPPGTEKTLLARACAAQTKSTYLKLAGLSLFRYL
jgi:26S proteasome regulatory subunit T5